MNEIISTNLGSLVNFQRGYDLPKSEFIAGAYPVISSNGVLGYHNQYKVKGSGVTIGRSGTVGLPHFIDSDFFPHNTSLFVQDFKGNDKRYIFYLLKNLALNQMSSGSGVPTLNRNHLHPLKVNAYTNLQKQQMIATVLYSLDAKIELNNRINAQLEQMAKTLYDYWFVQFDFPNKDGKPYKSSGGKMVYSEVLKREIPEGWEVGELGKWIDFKRGISYKSSEIQEVGTPLLSLNSFRLDGSFKIEGTKYFNGNFNDEKRVSFGDLVIAITDVTRNADIIGKSFIVPHLFNENPLFSCDVASVTATKEEKYYLEMLFNSERYHDYIKHFASGTLVLHLNLDGVRWFITYRPPTDLLKKYCAFREDLTKKKVNNLAENQKLTQLRDWLLPMLMNGQVRVKD